MELYFSPLSCPLATRIAVYEAGGTMKFRRVDNRAKRVLDDGSDFRSLNPLGMVPVLRTDDGELLTENVAVLQTVADAFPQAGLAPAGGVERVRLQKWLAFVSSELHKLIFTPLLDPTSNDGARDFARSKVPSRFTFLDAQLTGREFLLDRFTVADAYLVTVLNWARATQIDLAPYPNLKAYYERMHKRPSVERAFAEELAMYQEQAR